MKWTTKKSDKNKSMKPIIVFPYDSVNDGELHDYNEGWFKPQQSSKFNLH